MPGVQTLLNELNSQFTPSQIGQTAKKREEFAPGKPLVGVLVEKQFAPSDLPEVSEAIA
jgi:hypothetical protein